MLKRSLLATLGVMVSFLVAHPALGQATLVDAPDTVLVTTTSVDVSWDVLNDTSDSLYLVVSRFFVDTVSPFNYPYGSQPEGSREQFCWAVGSDQFCYPFGADSSFPNGIANLASGQSTSAFKITFVPNWVSGTSTLRYCFHDPAGAAEDGVCHNVTFVADVPSSIAQPIAPRREMVLAPNPANDAVWVDIDGVGKGVLEFRNLVGQTLKSSNVTAGFGRQRVSLDGMSPGVYLVSFNIDGIAASTKRLVIR